MAAGSSCGGINGRRSSCLIDSSAVETWSKIDCGVDELFYVFFSLDIPECNCSAEMFTNSALGLPYTPRQPNHDL